MQKPIILSLFSLCFLVFQAVAMDSTVIRDLALAGSIEGENVTFTLAFTIENEDRDARIPMVEGDVAYLSGDLPRKARLIREGNRLVLVLESRGKHEVNLKFASLPQKDGDWRHTQFIVPDAIVRKVTMACDRSDLDVQFPGAMRVAEAVEGETKTVTAFLAASDAFHVRWKPEVKQLDAALVVSCDANTIAAATVGALHTDTLYTYRIVQGTLQTLVLEIPDDVNVTQVQGDNILEWRIGNGGGHRELLVDLNRPQEQQYVLRVISELVLPDFPSAFSLPILAPQGVIRTSGFVLTGTESAIRLIVKQAAGLIQIDHDAFPMPQGDEENPRTLPGRRAYAYQYANLPFTLELEADDVVTAFHAEDRLVLSIDDRDVTLDAAIELDIRDAAAREIDVVTDPAWTVSDVSGEQIVDYDVGDEGGHRHIAIYFREGVLGRALVSIRLERALQAEEAEFEVPGVRVTDAKSERGFLVLRGQYGLRLNPIDLEGVREVQPGSLPIRVEEAQKAFRFKTSAWRVGLRIESTPAAIYSEIFNLVSLGEGALYGSCSITYHIEGAPVGELTLHIPEAYEQVEIVGRDVRNWSRSGEVWTVSMQERISGDFNLLVTYDQQFNEAGDEILVGGIMTSNTESEVGYIAVASASSLGVHGDERLDPGVMAIDRAEIPNAYRLLINDPVLRAYKYVRVPHTARLAIKRYPTQPLLRHVTDHTALVSEISEEGELVTTVTYFVKNASEQYLDILLPDGATLWTVHVDGESVQALNTGHDQRVLVPVRRHDDPNLPVKVELAYAESQGRIGLQKTLALVAPASAAQSVFASWQVKAPSDFSVGLSGGNMTTESQLTVTGLPEWTRRMGLVIRELFGDGILVTAALFMGLVGMALLAYALGRGRPGAVYAFAAAAVLAFCGLLAAGGALTGLDDVARALLGGTHAPEGATSFTRVVSLADSAPVLHVRVVPAWIGGSGSLWRLGLGVAIGAGLLLRIRRGGTLRPWTAAAAFTALTWALSQTVITLHVLVYVIVIGLPFVTMAWFVRRMWRLGARHAVTRRVIPEEPPPLVTPGFSPTGGPVEGGVSIRWLLAVAAAFAACTVVAPASRVAGAPAEELQVQAPQVQEPAPPPPVVVDSIELEIEAPGTDRDDNQIACITAQVTFDVEEPGSFYLLTGDHVLTDVDLQSERLELRNDNTGYLLTIERKGSYTVKYQFLSRIARDRETYRLPLYLPHNLQNRVTLRLPVTGMEIESDDAVLLKTEEGEDATETVAVFRPSCDVSLQWRPNVRRTQLEEAVFFCEMNSAATFEAGVVHVTHMIRYQIARGELQLLNIRIPEEMSVTSVQAAGLGTWRFDPATHQLEAVLEKPTSGEMHLTVVTQISRERLPYEVEFSLPEVVGAARQRGAMALMVPDSVQIKADEVEGLHLMNIGDFSPSAAEAANRGPRPTTMKRAFRYHTLPVRAVVRAESVLPELRVVQQGSLDISDERIVLSTQLDVSISRAGLFALQLSIPHDYEVESLTGDDLSHWDEVEGDTHRLHVQFQKQIMGSRRLNLVLARREKGIEDVVQMPRVLVKEAVKHTGHLVVSGETGVRFTTLHREGVSEVNPRELGITADGYLAFKLLRPEWAVELKTDVLHPVVRADVLQHVDLTEGMLKVRNYVRYQINNAGTKRFRFLSPRPGVVLNFVGSEIAQVREVDADAGLWQVDLQNKVQGHYALEIRCQVPLEPGAAHVDVLPLTLEEIHGQSGFLVVLTHNRLHVKPSSESPGLHREDARNIPREFGAGDLSDAILCYRLARADFALSLSVQRHDTASLLPATVNSLRMNSVVSEDDQMVTRVVMRLVGGNLRFLESTLPPRSRIWSVMVKGRPVTPLVQGDRLLIPLEEITVAEEAEVEFIYGGYASTQRFGRKHAYEGPKFNLPLNDIEWQFFVPPRFRYYDFDGTMKEKEGGALSRIMRFDLGHYVEEAQQEMQRSLATAEMDLKKGEQFAREGKQREARKAFESAMYNSAGAEAFNEDARIQYRNLARRQAVVGLVNRRENLKRDRNVQAQADEAQLSGFQEGNWTKAYGEQVEQSLDAEDNDGLNAVAERILDQQVAAAGVAPAIRITMPRHGRMLEFMRSLQIHPDTEMRISFKRVRLGHERWALSATITLGLLVVCRGGIAFVQKEKKIPAV